jgi:hypothetical protein
MPHPVQFANTRSLSQLFSLILNQFEGYVKENILQCTHEGDILYSFFGENRCGSTMQKIDRAELNVQELSHPVFPVIYILNSLKRSHQVTTNLLKQSSNVMPSDQLGPMSPFDGFVLAFCEHSVSWCLCANLTMVEWLTLRTRHIKLATIIL